MQLQDACQEDAASNSNERVAVNSLKDDGNSYKWFSYQCFNGSNNSNKVKKAARSLGAVVLTNVQ